MNAVPNVSPFHQPGWFWLLLVIPLLIFLYWRYWQHRGSTFTVSTLKGIGKANHNWLFSPPAFILLLRLFCILFIILAFADFRRPKTITRLAPVKEADIVLALDISKSMLIEDIKPNRLEALKEVLNKFIAGRTTDRFGIVLYAGESLYWCPITKDYPFLLSRLNLMDSKELADGTAIGLGLASAINALRQSSNKNKVVVLLTDGENNTGGIEPLTAAAIAKKYNIKVYTIGIGRTGMASIPIADFNGEKTYVKRHVSIDEEMLKKIAASTGGVYYNAQNATALQAIYNSIGKLEKSKQVQVMQINYVEQFELFVWLAIAFLLIEVIFRLTIFYSWL